MRLFFALAAGCTALATVVVFFPSPAALGYYGSDFLVAQSRQPVIITRRIVARMPVYNIYRMPVVSQRGRKTNTTGPLRPLPRWNAVNKPDPAQTDNYWVRERSQVLWDVCKEEFRNGDEFACYQRNSRLLRHNIVSINRDTVY
jgi:hypothetical protein